MPPRKSNVSATSNGAEDGTESPPPTKQKEKVTMEDLSLPKSMIQRLAKGVLPANTQIQKDALAALHKSATVFVSYIAATANENAQAGGKKTISPQDVMAALKEQEYEDFLPRCEAELKKYNEVQCDKRNTYRRKVKEEKAEKAAAAATGEGEDDIAKDGETVPAVNGSTTNGHVNGDEAERPAKKLKGDGGMPLLLDADEVDDGPDGELDDQDDANDQDEDVEEEVPDDDDDAEDDEGQDETMEDAAEELEDRGELRDEALDEPDSD